ncbi:MAG: ATP-binding protein [Limnochordia bacterium]|jgi:NAD-dependent dihydropyrimidine dehydrogenase PreA subunit
MRRTIIRIDEDKCDGCGLCVPACAEGAIQIIDGKARLIADNLCDGLGACLGDCPQGALEIVEAEAEPFDEEAVKEHLAQLAKEQEPCGCPGLASSVTKPQGDSQLGQWPVQLKLLPVTAPFYDGAQLVLTADCVPVAYPHYHRDFLAGNAVAIGCPKLDDGPYYVDKLTQIIKANDLKGITILYMEVPCCSGLVAIAHQALAAGGKDIPLRLVKIGIRGQIID